LNYFLVLTPLPEFETVLEFFLYFKVGQREQVLTNRQARLEQDLLGLEQLYLVPEAQGHFSFAHTLGICP
tara:strand:- start:157 stop:366 length:210 start_codon:yes stop_codon:yes gene_type:complete